jgi:hypothetical protein
MALTRERVRGVYFQLNQNAEQLLNLHLELSNILDQHHWDLIDRISCLHAENELDKVTKTQKNKFDRLMSKQRPNPKPYPTLENKKTVINRSSKQLSENATTLLSKGMNFAIAPARIPQEEIITEVETAIRHLPKEEAEEIRFETCRILKKSKPPKRNLSRDEMKALSELRKR